MPNLIESLGSRYCNEWLRGAFFLNEGQPHIFQSVDEDDPRQVEATRYTGDPDNTAGRRVMIPADVFAGWKALEFPTLGYRMAGAGRVLVYLTRLNSVRRGLHSNDLNMDYHEVSHYCADQLGINLNHYGQPASKACLALSPKYLPLVEGVTEMLAGNIACFAVSADFAVVPSTMDAEKLDILYRQRNVGSIDSTGKATVLTQLAPSWAATTEKDTN
jgi:hypothetical protein